MGPVTQEHRVHEEEVILWQDIEAQAEAGPGLPTNDEYSSEDEEPRIWKNAEPVSVEKPQVEYETEVPGPQTIIAPISLRRVDRVPLGQARWSDACLPCGQDTTAQPELTLYALTCGHR